jgi:redox-sensitive bicupin YhaK (pirin superfamily)
MILLIKLKPQGKVKLPPSQFAATRTLYFFEGEGLRINDESVASHTGIEVDSLTDIELSAGDKDVEVLLLQARPIGEPTVQYGPFVMNTREDIIQTIAEYQKNHFGGWPWPRQDMVHGPVIERFAKYPDGRIEKPR